MHMKFSAALNATLADLREIPGGNTMLSEMLERDSDEKLRRSRLLILALGRETGMSGSDVYDETAEILEIAGRIKLLEVDPEKLRKFLHAESGQSQEKDIEAVVKLIDMRRKRRGSFLPWA